MANRVTGKVFPVFSNKFKIGTKGVESAEADMVMVANLENFAPAIDGSVEQWFSMDSEGWADSMMSGKELSFSFSGKRTYGDVGNDYIANLAWKTGNDVVSPFEWEMPNGSKIKFDCVINVTAPGGGDTTALDALEFEIICKGKPEFTPATDPINLDK